jgi:preprotein translocase subunit SecF
LNNNNLDGIQKLKAIRNLMAIILILAPSTAHLSEVNSSKIQDVRLAKQITALEQELELTRKALAVAQDEAKKALDAEAQAKTSIQAQISDLEDQRTYAIIAAVIMFLITMFALFRKPRPTSS